MKHLKHNFETSETLETQCSLGGDWNGNVEKEVAEEGRRLEGPCKERHLS
jgi:hypothetical protein